MLLTFIDPAYLALVGVQVRVVCARAWRVWCGVVRCGAVCAVWCGVCVVCCVLCVVCALSLRALTALFDRFANCATAPADMHVNVAHARAQVLLDIIDSSLTRR